MLLLPDNVCSNFTKLFYGFGQPWSEPYICDLCWWASYIWCCNTVSICFNLVQNKSLTMNWLMAIPDWHLMMTDDWTCTLRCTTFRTSLNSILFRVESIDKHRHVFILIYTERTTAVHQYSRKHKMKYSMQRQVSFSCMRNTKSVRVHCVAQREKVKRRKHPETTNFRPDAFVSSIFLCSFIFDQPTVSSVIVKISLGCEEHIECAEHS